MPAACTGSSWRRAVARLRHPNVVACLDAGGQDRPGRPRDYYVVEFIPGLDLQRLVREQEPLPICRACDLFRQTAEALGEAHRHGLAYRDIKPSNLLVTPDWQAMVLDFGLALHPRRNVTEPGSVLGTVGYVAPEQATDATWIRCRSPAGSGSEWSGRLAAMLFGLFQTISLAGWNPRAWLTAYLDACAAAGGKPPADADRFLPWKATEGRRKEWSFGRAEPAESDRS